VSGRPRGYPPPVRPTPEAGFIESFKLLFTTDIGLLSLGVILFIIVMAIYLFMHFRKLMNEKPGKEGWD